MQHTRRKLLSSGLTLAVAGIAGCADEGEVETPTEEPVQEDSSESDGSEAELTPTATPTPETQVVPLGETLVYSGEDAQLAITAETAMMEDVLVDSTQNVLSTRQPESPDNTFLLVKFRAENQGSNPITLPGRSAFLFQNTQYDMRAPAAGYKAYQGYQEVQPGTSIEGWLRAEIPPVEGTGEVVLQFESIQDNPPTARWKINLTDIERTTYDFQDLEVGTQVKFGTEQTRYAVAVTGTEETTSYSYETGGFEYTEEPGSGNKFVLTEIQAENVGETPVTIPGPFEMSLIAGSTQVDAVRYRAESNVYEGGEIAPGVKRSGLVQFEVPESASSYRININLTRHVAASWTQ